MVTFQNKIWNKGASNVKGGHFGRIRIDPLFWRCMNLDVLVSRFLLGPIKMFRFSRLGCDGHYIQNLHTNFSDTEEMPAEPFSNVSYLFYTKPFVMSYVVFF